MEEEIGPSQILVDGERGELVVAAYNQDAVIIYSVTA